MRRLEWARIPVVVIAGNHDTPRLRTTGSVFGLLAMALPDVRFMTGYDTEEQSFEELGVMVHGVPHGALINPDPPALLHHPTMRNIVVTHGVAPGFATWAGREAGEADLGGMCSIPGSITWRLATSPPWQPGHQCLVQRLDRADVLGGSGRATGIRPGDLADRGDVPMVDFVDLPARPMETLSPIDGANGRHEIWRHDPGPGGCPRHAHAMVRVELNTPRPLFRETEAIVRREIGSAWHIRLTAPGDLLDPLGRDAMSGLAELHPLKLFDDFLRSRRDAGEMQFSGADAAALEAAIRKTQEAPQRRARSWRSRSRTTTIRWSHCIDFPEQGMVAITGPNGAGKTTLFEAIEWCLYGPAPSRTPRSRRTMASA